MSHFRPQSILQKEHPNFLCYSYASYTRSLQDFRRSVKLAMLKEKSTRINLSWQKKNVLIFLCLLLLSRFTLGNSKQSLHGTLYPRMGQFPQKITNVLHQCGVSSWIILPNSVLQHPWVPKHHSGQQFEVQYMEYNSWWGNGLEHFKLQRNGIEWGSFC